MEKRTVSLYFLNGFKRLKKEVKAFMVQCAIVSR
jgi:sRNA-binding regulator protein Hfq